MLKKVSAILIVMLIAALIIGCATHMHNIGNGSQTGVKETARQWYILWGLVPLNTVNTHTMAGNATDYEIKTEISFIDFLIGIPASYITIRSRTVTVTK